MRKGLVLGLVLVLVAALFFIIMPMNTSATSTIYIFSDGSVTAGAPIDVDGTTYTLTDDVYETIVIQKSGITLDGDGYTLDNGWAGTWAVFANGLTDLTIKNLVIKQSNIGIRLEETSDSTVMGNTVFDITRGGIVCWGAGATDNTIYDNTVSNCGWGIVVASEGSFVNIYENTISECINSGIICDDDTHDNTVTDNYIEDCEYYGISCDHSSSNTISGNYIEDTIYYGIYSYFSSSNTISDNEMVNNGINIWGNSVSYWNTHSIDTTNTVNGKPVIYWKDVDGGKVPKGAGQVLLANCENVKVTGQDIEYASMGIGLGFCSDCVVSDNTVAYSIYSIIVAFGTDNLVSDNEVINGNIEWGIYLLYSSNNQVSDNYVSGGAVGIRTYGESSSKITDNEVEESSSYGIFILYSTDMKTYDNSVSESFVGLYVYYTDYSEVKENTIKDNTYAIYLYYCNYNLVKENKLSGNTYQIIDNGGVDNIIEDNKIK